MKKTFVIEHAKIQPPRLFEAVKHELKKYVRRERNKKLPEGADFWDFDCKYGATAEAATVVHLSELNKCVDSAEQQGLTSFYIEILAKVGKRTPRPEQDS
ncbi:DUF6172 family protein [Simiduia curdlanivorans]|uniref:DUF6172 family protein n=1 Tax=Simiduia curdlanivorans TaxID=1492769 RepID=A0ABV8V5Y1_9GAMM|nr:DUF6172 family protein [Simiduia curdlanivorans]MDN3638661.1 DUF6172 family protein [Simiduia curdlanivorans]